MSAAANKPSAPRRAFVPTPNMVGRPGLSIAPIIPEISLGNAAIAGAGTADPRPSLVRTRTRLPEAPSFYIERNAADKLVKVDKPKDATWKFPNGMTVYDYLFSVSPEKEGEKAGEGAFGRVRKITVGGTDYILKIIRGYMIESILNEISMLEKVDGSPYVLKLLAAIIFSNRSYILSPYVPGETLTKWLPSHTDKADRLRVYNALLDGLDYIHSKGVIHRDIKPDNIWVPSDPTMPPFYIDFGISVETGENAVYQGTEHYKPAHVYGRGPQREELNYHALGVLFEDAPVPNSTLEVNLRRVGLKPNNVRGKRFTRRGRKTRRSRS